MIPLRKILVRLHRYAGLATALFIVIVGLTGCILAFNTELERVFAARLFAQGPHGTARLDLATLAEKAAALVPAGKVRQVTYTEPDQVSVYFEPGIDPATGRPHELGFDEFFMDPWTGKELGRRRAGDLRAGAINVMPFISGVHWRRAAGDAGQWIMGTVAIVWTLNALVGVALTLPTAWPGFLHRWGLAWKIKLSGGSFRRTFDFHRAVGVWAWGAMLVFACSSVMMNLRPFFEWVMVRATDYQPWVEQPARPPTTPKLGWHAAQNTGQNLLREQGATLGFTFGETESLMYAPESNTYMLMVRGSRDVFERAPKGGGTSVEFDGDTGALRNVSQPTGERTGNTIESWLYALHMARVGGRSYQVFVSAFGLGVAFLAMTGVQLWGRRQKRHRAAVE